MSIALMDLQQVDVSKASLAQRGQRSGRCWLYTLRKFIRKNYYFRDFGSGFDQPGLKLSEITFFLEFPVIISDTLGIQSERPDDLDGSVGGLVF